VSTVLPVCDFAAVLYSARVAVRLFGAIYSALMLLQLLLLTPLSPFTSSVVAVTAASLSNFYCNISRSTSHKVHKVNIVYCSLLAHSSSFTRSSIEHSAANRTGSCAAASTLLVEQLTAAAAAVAARKLHCCYYWHIPRSLLSGSHFSHSSELNSSSSSTHNASAVAEA
jgi:hypothetical protein